MPVITEMAPATKKTRSLGSTLAAKNALPDADKPIADRKLEREERVAVVRAALEQLAERDQQLLLMREEGFSYQEIAEAVGVAPGSVGTLIARAVRRFTEVYKPIVE